MLVLLSQWGRLYAESPDGTQQPQYKLLKDQYGYELIWRERKSNEWPQVELIVLSQGADRPRGGPWIYNWVARRDPVFLVSGDLPRVALMRNYRLPDLNPPFFKLGDLRIALTIGGHRYWLDEIDHVQTQFFAWGTVHCVRLGEPQIQATLTATLAGERGIAIELQLETVEPRSTPVQVELCYGGLAAVGSDLSASSYFPLDPLERAGDLVEITPAGGRIQQVLDVNTPSNPSTGVVHTAVEVLFDPPGKVSKADAEGPFIVSRHELALTSKPVKLEVLAFDRDDTGHENIPKSEAKAFGDYLQASQEFYQRILNQAKINTPDPLLNAGLQAAVVNLEYTYQVPGWLEGLQKWNSYIVNNYQISAAIALGQLDRAREALLFFGDIPQGPSPNRKSDGELFLSGTHQNDEGLPYFILQLYRYWQATGDEKTLDRLWAATSRNLEGMRKRRDPEVNQLLNWHSSANMFLYQADHLSLPGDAYTPTIFIAHDIALMSKMAAARGEVENSRRWFREAQYMVEETQRRLWDAPEGRYRAAIDTQGQVMEASFYTDYVLPMLSPELDVDQACAWVSLRTLDRKLWVEKDLMRCGDYKPPMFGNDQVMPLQMAEAAEAYFRAGRADSGVRLLHGVARAATVLTDSPGSFPERMSDSGFGQRDYGFGNPAGSFVRGVIAGLFGFERTRTQETLTWQPCIPQDWPTASLKIDGVGMEINGRIGDRTYTLDLRDAPQAVKLIVPLFGRKISQVTGPTGAALQYQRVPHPGGDFLMVNLPAAQRHTVRVQTEQVQVEWNPPKQVKGGQILKWKLPLENLKLIDPQQAFEHFKIEGKTLTGNLNPGQGLRSLLFEDRICQTMHAVELDFGSAVIEASKTLTGIREALFLDPHFNASSINGRTLWSWGEHKIDLTSKIVGQTGNRVMVGQIPFQVRTAGTNLVKLEIGDLTGENDLQFISEIPRSISLPIGKKIKGIEILNVAEFKTRLTGMRVGELVLCYGDGYRDVKPLVFGDNVDSMIKPFATNTIWDKSAGISFENPSVMSFSADTTREVERVEIHLTSADGTMAMLAINAVH